MGEVVKLDYADNCDKRGNFTMGIPRSDLRGAPLFDTGSDQNCFNFMDRWTFTP